MKQTKRVLFYIVFILSLFTVLIACEDKKEDLINQETIHYIMKNEGYYDKDYSQYKNDLKKFSIFELATANGFNGSIKKWFSLFLKASEENYNSAYEIYLKYNETELSEDDFVNELMILFFGEILTNKITFIYGNDMHVEIINFWEKIKEPSKPKEDPENFKGWLFEEKLWDFELMPEDDLTLVASWYSKEEYSINYHLSGGINSILNPDFYKENTSFILKEANKLGYEFKGWYDNPNFTGKVVENLLGCGGNIDLYAAWDFEIFNLPVININLDGVSLENVTKENYVNANISVLSTNPKYLIEEAVAEFKGRGHGSWTFDKKGYRIKFADKQSMFGHAKSKHWVLVAGGHDLSLMKNNTAYTIVNENLDAIEYNTSVNIIELYVNGNYQGVYSLFEHIRVDKTRIDIKSEFGVLDTGYLLEYDSYIVDEGIENIDFIKIPGLKYAFAIVSPDPEDYLEETTPELYRAQLDFIKSYLTDLINAILNMDYQRFSELADVDSFVDMYIIHELMKNTDTGWSSFYLYKKPGGKIYAGPAWDFDLSAGASRGDSSYEGLYVSDRAKRFSEFTCSEIYISLMKQSEFVNKVKTRYLEVHDEIKVTIENLFLEIAQYEDSYIRDAVRWTEGVNTSLTKQKELKSWLLARINWLKNWAAKP